MNGIIKAMPWARAWGLRKSPVNHRISFKGLAGFKTSLDSKVVGYIITGCHKKMLSLSVDPYRENAMQAVSASPMDCVQITSSFAIQSMRC
jgi:hypothetical protein